MTKFEKVPYPMAVDFYSIETDDKGEKQIHFSGWIEKNDDGWRYVEVCFFIEPLRDFVKNFAENEDYLNEEYSRYKQYICDVTEEETVNIINSYFNGSPADYILSYSDVTMNTPCGNYIF